MSLHTTNYYNSFVEIAPDSTVVKGETPLSKGDKKTAATIQFDMISKNPYEFTSDDVVFQVFAEKNDLTEREYEEARKQFFSKGQPCLRASALTKRYGWGVHYNADGKIAIYGVETEKYHEFLSDSNLKTYKAMRSSK
ncbi:MAG: hypothetical protein EOO07_37955 [Chitinophagaceae bacterium]|nr:MAG: hypothetical protein EOO07_37955 [Chitinophagaceae bacterium]